MHRAFFWQIFLLNVALVGCTNRISQYEQCTEMVIPETWHSLPSEGMHAGDPEGFIWWESFEDPILNSLMRKGAQQNLDLCIAGTRLLEARAYRQGKMADLYPHLDASLTTGRLYYSKDALVNGILRRALSSHQIGSVDRNVSFFELGFDASWEIDLFGATKHQLNALEAKIEAAEENLCDLWVTLSAEIARNYIELRSLQKRRQIILEKIEIQEDNLYLIQELFTIGLVDRLDLLRAEEQLKGLRAEKPIIELSVDKTLHHLSILLGDPPGDLFLDLCEPKELPCLPCEKPIGLPCELLRRRPDIRRAEKNVSAATELVSSAVAELFPRLSLFGFVGTISTQLKSLANGVSGTWLAAPQLLLPIFNSKLLTQDVNLNKIQAKQALFEYQKTVLEALEETENAIASFRYALERHQTLYESREASQQAQDLTLQLYQRGLKDYLDVHVATHALLTADELYIQSQTELLLHYISLYKALGGGWDLSFCHEEEDDSLEKEIFPSS